ncbi:MAG TPA: low specificity L-threonine aldolase [Maritimibacter sp.]|nr:low specificity L-threonine aldolase [Maritimibacter sp.]
MHFASDNSGPVHPKILEALTRANEGYAMGYGADDQTTRATQMIRDVFEAPEASVHFVATGTAANALALATMVEPFETVFCSDVAHIHEDECNAPEFFTGGAKLTLVPTDDGRMTPEALRSSINGEENRGVHGPQRGPVSITNVTERGTVYSVAAIKALTDVAKGFDLAVHLDGARFANALVSTGASAAEMTWKAGVDAVSFGGTKNGCMGVEAVVFFDPKHGREFELRRKRGGHLFSKYRYLAAQMTGYLENDLWLDLARKANMANTRLVEGLRRSNSADFLWSPDANMTFATLPAETHEALFGAGASYHLWEGALDGAAPDTPIGARFVCDWSMTEATVDAFLAHLKP